MPFSVGDLVTMPALPPWADSLPAESQAVFRFCVGREYRISEITSDGLVILDVSNDVDVNFGGFMNDLRIEPEFIRAVDAS